MARRERAGGVWAWLALGGGAIALVILALWGRQGVALAIAGIGGPSGGPSNALVPGLTGGGDNPGAITLHHPPHAPQDQPRPGLAQELPLEALLRVGDEVLWFEVARTAEQRSRGLMFRTELARDRGMAFFFEPPRSVSFWMKNTLIPLDMVFLRDGVVHHIEANVPPCKADPCPSYGPRSGPPTDLVLELAAGRAAELGIQPGDRLALESVDWPEGDASTSLPGRAGS
ncbi:MAG: hypothetical protein Fur0042_00100 [Cyanophyceae cyanobacterium]